MEEAEYCDRIAIMDHGRIAVVDSPRTLKSSVGGDRVWIRADDAPAALRERFGLTASPHGDALTFAVPDGASFLSRLFAELGVPIRSVQLTRPSLGDVFLALAAAQFRRAD